MQRLLQLERTTKLGRLGEDLVAERLVLHGFSNVENLNARRANYPFGDLLATRQGARYFVGVKTRNENRQGDVGLNESYNIVLMPSPINKVLKEQGRTTEQITALLLEEVSDLADKLQAIPAWATVAVRPRSGTYSAYFGVMSALGNRRSVPMTPKACSRYECLARDVVDPRVSADLLNAL